jgi:hypothetical protein
MPRIATRREAGRDDTYAFRSSTMAVGEDRFSRQLHQTGGALVAIGDYSSQGDELVSALRAVAIW